MDSTPDSGEVDAGVDVESRPATRLRLATFNVGRFFDTTCDSNNCGDENDFERQLSSAEFSFKADQIAAAIEELDPDAIALQELETEACLDALAERLPEYDIREFGEIGGTATLDTAILARGVVLLETRTHRDSTLLTLADGRTQRFARELLEVHFDADGERVALLSAHFKAKRNDDPEWRLAEAEGARAIVEERMMEFPDALVVLGGDLNDTPDSEPLLALTGNDGLELVTSSIPEEDAWTFSFGRDRILIDHLLYPDTAGGELVPGSAEIVRDGGGGLGGSDHAALVADFDVWLD